ncbi:MAG TPA: AAA family ATPase [Thermomicrobiales bacterium]|nr:AAA family ATPase [Thermomicrobiales bacterium]
MVLVAEKITLIGRDHERAELERSATAAHDGYGSFILVSGDAGIGKTCFVRQVLAGTGLVTLAGQSYQGVSLPYGALATALRAYLAAESDARLTGGPMASHLALVLPELGTPPPTSDRAALFEALRSALVAIADRRPLAIFFDDIHWADQATLDLLPALAGALAHEPLLIVAAYRSDEVQRGHPVRRLRAEMRRAGRLQELAVGPFDRDGTAKLVARALGAEPSPALTAAIYDRTEGVPFFIEELAVALAGGRRLRTFPEGLTLDDDETLPLPESVREVIGLQVEAFPPQARRVLEIAAVAGQEFDLDIIATLAGDDEPGLSQLLDSGFLVESGAGRGVFRHALKREACYLDIPWMRRRELHQRMAAHLDTGGAPASIVAEHWLASRNMEQARRALVAAGEASSRSHAYRDAVVAFRRALELWCQGVDERERIGVLERLGTCSERSGDLAEATRAWREVAGAHRQSGETGRLATAESRLAGVYEVRGDWVHALSAREAAANAFAAADQPAEAATQRLMAAAHLRTASNFHGALTLLDIAREDVGRSGRVDLQARLLGLEGNIRVRLGESKAGLDLVRTGLALALERNLADTVAVVYQLLADALEHTGDYASAKETYLRAYDYCQRNAADTSGYICLSCLSVVLWQMGEWERAIEICRDILATAATPPHARAAASGSLGIVHALRGEARVARPFLIEAAMLAQRVELAPMQLLVNWGLALIDDQHDATEAVIARCREILSRWEQTEDRHYIIPVLGWAVTYCAEHGAEAEARAIAAALATIADGINQPEALAALSHALGEIALLDGDVEQALTQFEHALGLLRDSQLPFDRARTERRAGNAYARIGKHDSAVAHLTSAHRAARKLGARPLATLIACDLKALGEPVERHLGRRVAGQLTNAGLSRRELEVLRLVAVGRTSREIGEQLFISPRTVEMHVQSTLAKLDCRSRAEATRKAADLGLLEPVADAVRHPEAAPRSTRQRSAVQYR